MKLWVFDFDDTLVRTDAVTHVTNGDRKFDLSPDELATYECKPGDVFNHTEFKGLVNPRAVKWVNRILHNVYAHHGASSITILTARGHREPVERWLALIGLSGIEIVTLNSLTLGENVDLVRDVAHVKASWISERIERDGLSEVEFFDDNHKNVVAVDALRHLHPNVTIIVRHITHDQVTLR